MTDFTAVQGERLVLDDALWTGTRSAADVVADFATVAGGNARLAFAGGEVLVLTGVSSLNGLAAAIDII